MRDMMGILVLHVDDELNFAELAADMLEREDERFTVKTATSASEGLAQLADRSFDCIVSDYDMPEQNGIEFLKTVREDHPDLPFILYTGKGSEEVASDAISAGVTDYFEKDRGPEQFELLANRIRNAVERARAQRDRKCHRNAIETTREGISILNEDGEFVYVNEAYADLYGYDPEEMIGEHWELIYRDEDVPRIQDEILPIVETNGHWHGETTGLRADGSTFVEDHVLTTTETGGLVCTVQNVTDRKKHEQAIEDLHKTAREFMKAETAEEIAEITAEAVPNVLDMPGSSVHLYDESEGGLVPVAWTDRTEELVGEPPTVPPGEGIAWTAFETGETQIYDDISTVPERYNPDTVVRSQIALPLDGHGVLVSNSPEPNAFDETDVDLADVLATHATTALDRSDRHAALREKRNFLDRLFEQIPIHLYVKDDQGRYLYVSDYYDVIEPDKIIGRTDRELYPEAGTYEDDIHVIETEEPIINKEEYVPSVDHWNLTSKVPWYDEDGNVAGLIGVTRRITKRKEYERELERQNERLDEFASVVSHDLRNPLNVAAGRLELVQRECDSDHLDDVARAHDRIEALIDDLLTLAREGKRVDETEVVDLANLTDGCWRTVETADATLVTETEQTIRADLSRLKQLLENLFRNAVEHADDDVTVTVGDLDGGFYVADDGPGIPDDECTEVFDAGYSTTDDGTGFGLKIVQEIAEAHKWDVRVTTSDAGGARFELTGVDVVDE